MSSETARTRSIVYVPEAKFVSVLMAEMVAWINAKDELPVPLKAAIVHYQDATIDPYYDGNGRTRLLTTLILHLGGDGLKGPYALEEYYARDLKAYYEALTSDRPTITIWVAPRPTLRDSVLCRGYADRFPSSA